MNLSPDPRIARLQMLWLLFTLKLDALKRDAAKPIEEVPQPAGRWSW